MRKNIIWRAALVLMALTLATTSLTLSSAKYFTDYNNNAGWSTAEFGVYQMLSYTGSTSVTVPKGKWAFYVQGYTGSRGSGNYSANHRRPGKIWGIYTLASDNTFTAANAPAGSVDEGSGGKGGDGRYIYFGSTAPTSGAQTMLVAVAGGGGGSGATGGGGDAGWADGHNGGAGWQGGRRGNDNSNNNSNSGRDGGGGAQSGGAGGTWACPAANGSGSSGGFLQGGRTNSASGGTYNRGSGGGGWYGGGAGGPGGTSGAGGGGSSMSNATSGIPDSYANPSNYYEYAVNYFWSLNTETDGAVLLVWLGP